MTTDEATAPLSENSTDSDDVVERTGPFDKNDPRYYGNVEGLMAVVCF